MNTRILTLLFCLTACLDTELLDDERLGTGTEDTTETGEVAEAMLVANPGDGDGDGTEGGAAVQPGDGDGDGDHGDGWCCDCASFSGPLWDCKITTEDACGEMWCSLATDPDEPLTCLAACTSA